MGVAACICMVDPSGEPIATHTPRLIVFGGGVPVHIDGGLVGAVGVSGGSAEQDRAIAEAGAAVVHR
jgi:glc operon protein GlcG